MTVPKLLLDAGFDHVSERESDGTWEDCTWCAGLEWFRLCYDAAIASTHAEMQALRAASGEPLDGGSNIGNLRDGIRARYGVTVVGVISGFNALKAALTPGNAAVVQGSMKVFGSTHRLSVWDRGFDGAHAALVVNVAGLLYWCDPEAPETAAVPVTITWAELQLFVNAFAGQYLVAPIKLPVKEDAMPNLTSYIPGFTANIKAESNVRADPFVTGTKLRMIPKGTKEPVVLVGTVRGSVDSANGSDIWFTWFKNGRWEYTAKDNVIDITPPTGVNDGFTAATQLAAVAAQAQADKLSLNATVGKAVEIATTTATHAERERLALAAADHIRNL